MKHTALVWCVCFAVRLQGVAKLLLPHPPLVTPSAHHKRHKQAAHKSVTGIIWALLVARQLWFEHTLSTLPQLHAQSFARSRLPSVSRNYRGID